MNHVSPITHLVMIAWVPLVQVLFMLLPPRRAVIASYLGAWLFLPVVIYQVPMLPDVTKMLATSVAVLIAVGLFDPGRFATLRPRLYDLPMVAWCIAPFFSSITNGLGVYDGVTAILDQAFVWGLPYLTGRMYFTDLRSLRELAIGLVIGGLIYVPLCGIEARLSPQLHRWVYGFHPNSFQQTQRFGGWRPTVFMQHGLMVAMWMTSTLLVGFWLWWTKSVRKVLGVPMVWCVGALLVGEVLIKSAGAWAACVMGIGCLAALKWFRTPVLVAAIGIGVPGYMVARTIGGWDGSQLEQGAEAIAGHERAASLQMRLDNEDLLTDKALRKPLFGWGRWGRHRVFDEDGNDISTTDGLWVIVLGQAGLFGLSALVGSFFLPALNVGLIVRKREWRSALYAAPTVLALLLVLYMMDNILNAMVNPVYTLIAGGLAGLRRARPVATTARRARDEAHAADAVASGDDDTEMERAA